MNVKRWLLLLLGSGLMALILIGVLTMMPVFAQGPGGNPGGMMGGYGPGWMMGGYGHHGGMMSGGYGPGGMMGYTQGYSETAPYGRGGMMGGYGPGWMMGYTQGYSGTYGCGFGGMMGGYGPGGLRGGGMMGGGMVSSNSPFFTIEPLTVAEATEAVNTYLADLNDDNLKLAEVMIFDNHAYAEVVEQDTGIGAMELIVDPETKAVYPEMGPNMMWNLKYGMMAGYWGNGMMGRGYGNRPGSTTPAEVSAEMTVTPAQAVEAAQAYLDSYVGNNLKVEAEAEPFYGYYTLHVSRDGQIVGMLGVNGYSQQVFLHTWHGELLEMSEE